MRNTRENILFLGQKKWFTQMMTLES